MFPSRWFPRTPEARLAWIPIVLVASLGCETAPQRLEPPELKDDFGSSLETRPITEESVGETQMLHRRVQLELKGAAAIPTGFFQDNGFEVGASAGAKGEIELVKDFFLGLSFDYVTMEQGDGVSDVLSNPLSLSGVEPDQLYDTIDRYNFLAVADYDWTLARSFLVEKAPLKFRLGGGLGATVVDGEVDSSLEDQIKAAGGDIETVPYVGFLARASAGVRWQVLPTMLLFAEVSLDFVYPFEIEIRLNRVRSTVDGDIDFGSVNLGGGVAFEF
ncbi:MAG: hypothetical protein HY721_27785 [Planctomycetes bacterium]|nr:hypothetical protein [Planctomycetota bacterium]